MTRSSHTWPLSSDPSGSLAMTRRQLLGTNNRPKKVHSTNSRLGSAEKCSCPNMNFFGGCCGSHFDRGSESWHAACPPVKLLLNIHTSIWQQPPKSTAIWRTLQLRTLFFFSSYNSLNLGSESIDSILKICSKLQAIILLEKHYLEAFRLEV